MKDKIKRLIQFYLTKKGYFIKKIISVKKINLNKNYLIEIVGPTGVGKSTIFNGLNYKKEEKDFYKTYSFTDKKQYYSEIIKKKIDNVLSKNEITPFQKIKLFSFFCDVISLDYCLKNKINSHSIIVEEGLFQSFKEEVINLKKEDLDRLLKKRAFIFVVANEEDIYERVIKRKRKALCHLDLSKKQIFDVIREQIKFQSKLLSLFKKKNIPFLEIDSNKNITFIFQEINIFLKKIGE